MKKNILTIAALLLLSFTSFAQNGREIYKRYSEQDGVTAVYISPAMFRIIGKLPDMEIADKDINVSKLIKSLSGFYLLDCDDTDISRKLRNDVDGLVSKGGYEMIMEAKEDGEIVNIYTLGTETTIKGFVMTVKDKNESTFIFLDGELPREQFEKMLSEK